MNENQRRQPGTDVPQSEFHRRVTEKGDFVLTIGSHKECELAFPGHAISPEHAQLKREGDRLFLRDMDSKEGTTVNGKRLGKRWREVTLHDTVSLGGIELELEPSLLLGRARERLDVKGLRYSLPKAGKSLFGTSARTQVCSDVSFSAEPGTMTCIMGPSGSGKTVLLNLLAGFLVPDAGEVRVGHYDLHSSFGLIKDIVGYVPQEETLLADLTVRQSLHYSLKLRYADMSREVRDSLIDNVLKRMGFSEQKIAKILDTRIGSVNKRGISGGERKRISIAHEFVSNPLIMLLDEPTSGLSSVDSEQVIELLRESCRQQQRTVVMTIHQPSRNVFEFFDQVLLLHHNGTPFFIGSPAEAVRHFEALTGVPCGKSNPAEYLLQSMERVDPQDASQRVSMAVRPKDAAPAEAGRPEPQGKKQRPPILHQTLVLLLRNLQIKWADRGSLLLMLIQAPLIAMLLAITFFGYQNDYRDWDSFARIGYHFNLEKERKNKQGQTVFVEKQFEESRQWARDHDDIKGRLTTHRKLSVLFLMLASAIWLGIVNASREVVAERAVVRKEAKSYLMFSSYLVAKIATLALVALVQTGILLVLTDALLLQSGYFFSLWGVVLLTALAGSTLGLFVSSLAETERASLMAIPILIIPQLLFGGLIRPIFYVGKDSVFHFISDFVLQNWSFKSCVLLEAINGLGVLKEQFNFDMHDAVNTVTFTKSSVVGLYYLLGGDSAVEMAQQLASSLGVMSLHLVVPVILAYVALKVKYR